MAGTEGVVEVRFSVDAAGGVSVQGAAGAEVLKAAAEGVVASWTFRRTTTRRLYLAAEVSYKADSAAAKVRPQE
jgi:outer membrane biosynthesis protein TonB